MKPRQQLCVAPSTSGPVNSKATQLNRQIHDETTNVERNAKPYTQVCSYYATKFPNDGTKIKFIYEPGRYPLVLRGQG